MRVLGILSIILVTTLFLGCSAIKLPVSNEYQLSAFSSKQYATKPQSVTLLVTAPEAVAGYQTEQMLYVNKPFQLEAFTQNAWSNPPADMLFPLLVQSMQRTGFFYAVASSPYNSQADYRLDTQLLALKQSFLQKPSLLEFSVKIVLTRVEDSKVIASRIISKQIPCSADTPYGGVVAANKASEQFTGPGCTVCGVPCKT